MKETLTVKSARKLIQAPATKRSAPAKAPPDLLSLEQMMIRCETVTEVLRKIMSAPVCPRR